VTAEDASPIDPSPDEDALETRFQGALDRAESLLEQGDFAAARKALLEATELSGNDHPEVLYVHGCIIWQELGPDAAQSLLEQAVQQDYGHADARYALARIAEERGDRKTMIDQHLHVLALDARNDRQMRLGTQEQLDQVERVARELLAALPSPFVERLHAVPVVLERRPTRDLVKDGFDPRSLGLFEGPTHGDTDTPAPTRIVLYVNNLLADFPKDPELSDQIEITLLHEIGHFFGLDEDDMVRLGLD
jgi:predicted Zn-dependent protease with MMP-like domain